MSFLETLGKIAVVGALAINEMEKENEKERFNQAAKKNELVNLGTLGFTFSSALRNKSTSFVEIKYDSFWEKYKVAVNGRSEMAEFKCAPDLNIYSITANGIIEDGGFIKATATTKDGKTLYGTIFVRKVW